MYDNDHLKELSSAASHKHAIYDDVYLQTPFHLTKQHSISEIAPETQRSHNNNMMCRSSLENIY